MTTCEVIKTYRMTGGIGLMKLAMGLAMFRKYGYTPIAGVGHDYTPYVRSFAMEHAETVSFEYYQIIDRITRGEKP